MLVAAILVIDLAIPSITQARSGGSLLTDAVIFQQLQWRSIGPKRGGRSLAVAGHKDRRNEYYFGATGGGLWKTTDGGTTWDPVTDGQIGSSSVGAVAVAESSPDVVYVGMGETQLRQNVLQGDGIYRSDDGGKSWVHLGLDKTRAISRIRIHPEDPDRVYVAALGNPFGASPERGIFRTLDGGRTWQKVLYRNEKTGAIDLVLDPNNPDVMYASLWQVYRKPFILWSGGEGSGVFKSKDGGETWK
ncbi:MAG: glycosyl hydrolase, partial [bacterium]|nr:glycosyl hydrolase [bacterium]